MTSVEKIRNKIVNLSRHKKAVATIFSDLALFNLNFILCIFIFNIIYLKDLYAFQSDFFQFSYLLNFTLIEILISSFIGVFFIYVLDGYKSFFRSSGPLNIIGSSRIFSMCLYASLIFLVDFNKSGEFLSAVTVSWFQFLYVLFYFLVFRTLIYVFLSKKSISLSSPVIIYGAGQAGRETAAALSQVKEYNLLGFIDDDIRLKNYQILGIRILGNIKKIIKIKKIYPNILVILAIQNINSASRNKIISLLEPLEVQVKTIPPAYGGLETKLSIENISVDDLIGREESSINNTFNSHNIKGKNVLISGAGGSIGSELAFQVANLNPKNLIFIDSSEYNLYKLSEIFKTFKNLDSMKFLLRDIQDKEEIEILIEGEEINTIFHAAAYKHVPLLQNQMNVKSAIKNNFFGTFDLCEIAFRKKIDNFTLISTDKAVNPTNIMGATKRLAELSLQSFQDEVDNETCFSMVRFGNVLNSSGSVVPLFWDQISKGGPVTVTHQDVNRFFMTIKEASSLVLMANSIAKGGEVFLLDMGDPIKIKDLAEKMIKLSGNSVSVDKEKNGIEIIYSGLRPGEKLFEELLLSNDPVDTEILKIKKGLEKKFNLEKISNLKENIKNLLNSQDFNSINKIISEFVDGY